MKRRAKSDGIAMATRWVLDVGLTPQRQTRRELDAMMRAPWRQERLREFRTSDSKTLAIETHKPSDRPLIAARIRREREASAWIERVKARKAAK